MPPAPKPLEITQILSEILRYGGITCGSPPILYLWRTVAGNTMKYQIKTLAHFLETFGPGTYQIEIENPVIEGIDLERVQINILLVEINYDGKGGWSKPRIHTEEEEILPEYAEGDIIDSKKVEERLEKMGRKVKGALTLLGYIYEAYGYLKVLLGG